MPDVTFSAVRNGVIITITIPEDKFTQAQRSQLPVPRSLTAEELTVLMNELSDGLADELAFVFDRSGFVRIMLEILKDSIKQPRNYFIEWCQGFLGIRSNP